MLKRRILWVNILLRSNTFSVKSLIIINIIIIIIYFYYRRKQKNEDDKGDEINNRGFGLIKKFPYLLPFLLTINTLFLIRKLIK